MASPFLLTSHYIQIKKMSSWHEQSNKYMPDGFFPSQLNCSIFLMSGNYITFKALWIDWFGLLKKLAGERAQCEGGCGNAY